MFYFIYSNYVLVNDNIHDATKWIMVIYRMDYLKKK